MEAYPTEVEGMTSCQPTAHRFAFSDSASLRVGQTRADSASLRLVPVMKSSHRGAPASPLTPSGVESSVSHGRRPLRESLDIRALPPSRRPRPSRERQTGVTGRFPVRRAEPTFLADEMSAPADFQVNDAVSEERTSGRSNALSVRNFPCAGSVWDRGTCPQRVFTRLCLRLPLPATRRAFGLLVGYIRGLIFARIQVLTHPYRFRSASCRGVRRSTVGPGMRRKRRPRLKRPLRLRSGDWTSGSSRDSRRLSHVSRTIGRHFPSADFTYPHRTC